MENGPTLGDLIAGGHPVGHHRPWPRAIVDAMTWRTAIDQLADGQWSLLGLWGEVDAVHMALFDPRADDLGIISLDCADGRYLSVSQRHPPALRLERTARDLFGLEPEGLPDLRPWLDHGHWGLRHPLGEPADTQGSPPPYAFLPAEGEDLHQIPVGPVHAGIIEPGHFRFTVNGETVVRVEQRLGYAHKGIEGLMTGADLERGATLAARTSGDSTVAYGLAFARAAEAALGVDVPPRADFLRALMAELERLANHIGDIGAICNDASFAMMHAHTGVLREAVLRACDTAFGHRLMRDRIMCGGVAAELEAGGISALRGLLTEIRRRLPALIELYDDTASLSDRTVGTGMLKPALANQYAAGGYIGRASGRGFDARHTPGYPPYGQLKFDIPVLDKGDVDARVWIRIKEVEQSLALVDQILDQLPDGPIRVQAAPRGALCEGVGFVEGFRGDILVWLRLHGDGRIARCHLRDPSWFQWPLLEAVVEGNIVADFPICNKSFNCSYSGHDL